MAPVCDDVAGGLVTTGCAGASDAENDPLVAVWVDGALLVWVLSRTEVLTATDVELVVDVVVEMVLEEVETSDEEEETDVDEAEELEDAAEDPPDGLKAAAIFGFDDRKPAVRSPNGQPSVHGFDLQHPINGGVVAAQVYHLLPIGHS